MARELTDKQQKFLTVLFEEAKGNYVQAKKLAGYSETYSTKEIVEGLEEEIATLTKKFIARIGVKAAFSMLRMAKRPHSGGLVGILNHLTRR